jgi:hypothetical protein
MPPTAGQPPLMKTPKKGAAEGGTPAAAHPSAPAVRGLAARPVELPPTWPVERRAFIRTNRVLESA